MSADENVRWNGTRAYRSANIIQQPVHVLTADVYLERMLRDA